MGFTTPCFIRKNTEELRKKLEDIWYKNAGSSNHHDIIYTDTEHGVYFPILQMMRLGMIANIIEPCSLLLPH